MAEIAKAEIPAESVSLLARLKKIPFSTAAVGALYLGFIILGVSTGVQLRFLLMFTFMRLGMQGVLVLANVPSIQAGMGPNFALPIGVVSGHLAMIITMGMIGLTGWPLIGVSALIAIVFGCISGFVYGKLMNATKGSEMAIAPYTGFAITFIFSVVWLVIPIDNVYMTFFLGDGLRTPIDLTPFAAHSILANLLTFNIFGITIRTGELLVFAIACFLMWMFFRTKTGIAISAVGANPMFAKATGINVDRSRIIAMMISTSVAALGIIVFVQGLGILAIYDAPLWMGFPAAAAILVGGASAQRAKVQHVVIGTFLFQGLLGISMPVMTNVLPPGTDIADPIRMIVQNGVILYALTRMAGGGK
jgi:simple sugar transport system permease protein